MASTLLPYKGAAKNREKKLERAIESVLSQKFEDWELIIVADGCQKTLDIAAPYFYEYNPKIKLYKIPKQKIWAGAVRNAGIFKAEGDIITFLDNDDALGVNHLQIINDNFGDYDWVYYDHLIYSPKIHDFDIFKTNVNVYGQCGTCSVSYKRSLDVYWTDDTYRHDYVLINTLKQKSNNYGRIPQTEYMILHVPNRFDI